MNASLKLLGVAGLLFASSQASALTPACETYLRAAEKSASQSARHVITETDGVRIELVVVGGSAYTRMGPGPWRQMKTSGKGDPIAMERQLVAAIRAGEYKLSGCRKVGSETIDGKAVSVYAYTLAIPGMPGGEAKAYIGADGLVHGQKSDGTVVRHRYTGVTAPKL